MSGRRALLTGPDSRALAELLVGRGWQVRAVPTVAIRPAPTGPLDAALRQVERYDWIVLTSRHGARVVADRLRALGLPRPQRPRWAAVGPATERPLVDAGLGPVVRPPRALTAAVADVLGDVAGRRVLLPRSDQASVLLPAVLRERGARVDEVVAYLTVEGPEESRLPLRRALEGGVDVVVFTSGSTVRGFARLADDVRVRLAGVAVACIGPVTAEVARALGMSPTVIAEEHTAAGVAAALEEGPHASASSHI
ncbi:MAG: uroporphyrinogen-III synthase [Armatimonadota bacterium]|nr:uroporphyrinogen-III synthase [Armatimonadota bacterium]MDR7404076.1 uroporphyrinogen-III synthase [Armatimonadota bacterium]